MEFKELISKGIELAKSEPIIAAVVLGIIAILFYFKTKSMLKLLAIVLVLAFLFYVFALFHSVTSKGITQKERMGEKSQ